MIDADRQWLRLRWPHEVTEEHVQAGLFALNGLSTTRRRDAMWLIATGTDRMVTHSLVVPTRRHKAVTERLRHAIPGLVVEDIPPPKDAPTTEWLIWMSSRVRPLRTTEPEMITGGLLVALASAGTNETLTLAWLLGPVRRPSAVPSRTTNARTEPWRQFIPIGVTGIDNEARSALVNKQGEPGWRALGRVGVRAATRERELQLLQRVTGALRVAQGPGVQIGAHRALPVPSSWKPARSWRRPLALNVSELTGLACWPIGDLESLPVEGTASRVVPVSRSVPRKGRLIGMSSYPGEERTVAISVRDSLSHLWTVGPTGSGKSTFLAQLCAGDLEAGRSVVVIDPKGDLVTAILERVPERRREDVVVLDAGDDGHPIVGLNPLLNSRRQPELIADQLLGLFRVLSGEAWGPRTADVLHAGLLTLAQQPDVSLCALPVLLSDPGYRRQVLQRLDDPIGLQPFWASFEALSRAEREQTVAPVQRRLRQLLLRPRMRAVLGQTHPRFELQQVFTERKILLVSLAKGVVGPEASALLGSIVVSQLWQLTLGRAAVAPERRHPVMVFIDELQDHVHGVTDVGEMLAQARGLGVAIHAAHQHLGQLEPGLRAALSANARSRIVFQTSNEDAAFFARGQRTLRPEDFQRLPRYEVYASLLAAGHVTPYGSVRMPAPSPKSSDPNELRKLSRARFGRDAGEIEAELRHMVAGPTSAPSSALGSRRRSS